MGGARLPKPIKPPSPPDEAKARINALAYSELERRIRQSQGRGGSFMRQPSGNSNMFKTLLGQ